MKDEALQTWGYVHDWYLDSLTIGPNVEPRTLALGLYLGSRRAVVTFNGATRVAVDRLGLLNIAFGIHVISPDDAKYERACRILATGERITDRKADTLAFFLQRYARPVNSSHQHNIVLFLTKITLHLQRNRFPDEIHQHRQML
jgi:hypothetical protein